MFYVCICYVISIFLRCIFVVQSFRAWAMFPKIEKNTPTTYMLTIFDTLQQWNIDSHTETMQKGAHRVNNLDVDAAEVQQISLITCVFYVCVHHVVFFLRCKKDAKREGNFLYFGVSRSMQDRRWPQNRFKKKGFRGRKPA